MRNTNRYHLFVKQKTKNCKLYESKSVCLRVMVVQFHTPTVTIFLSHKNLHKTICVATARIRPLPTNTLLFALKTLRIQIYLQRKHTFLELLPLFQSAIDHVYIYIYMY